MASLLLMMQMSGSQNMMKPAGPASESITSLGWIVFITFLVVSVVMWVLIAWVAARRRGAITDPVPVDPGGGQSWILVGGLMIPLAVLTTLFILNIDVLSGFPILDGADPPPQIRVIGHQWWWEVQYIAGPVDTHFTTANEIHIPVGQNIDIELISTDVIHSFWIPRLNGKEDVVPGQPNIIRLRADQPGTYRGQCAEFCGEQHAHMAIIVVAQPPDEYQAWLAHQRLPAAEPSTDKAKQGQQVFLTTACALCHAIRGTGAAGGVAPDLTHIATRQGLAANTLGNDTANLEAWITHAQSLKPGVAMPNLTIYSGDQLTSLVTYLQQLR